MQSTNFIFKIMQGKEGHLFDIRCIDFQLSVILKKDENDAVEMELNQWSCVVSQDNQYCHLLLYIHRRTNPINISSFNVKGKTI